MARRSVGIVLLSALVANALILPPGIASTSSDGGLAASIVNPKHRFIQLPCSSCAFASKTENVEESEYNDDRLWIQGGANNIALDFSISEDGQRLELYGEAIYPVQLYRDALLLGQHIYVEQVPASASDIDVRSGDANSVRLEVTSSGWKTESRVPASEDGDVVTQLRFQVLGLEGQPVNLDEVEIQLLETGDGELLILRLERHSSSTFLPFTPPRPHFLPPPPRLELDVEDAEECMLPAPICRFRDMLKAKIEALRNGEMGQSRPCPGMKGSLGDLPADIRTHHGRPHHERPYGDHDHKHPALHSFARSVIAVLIPVMAGISVGLLVSLMGLLVGRLIGFVWIKLSGGGQCGYACVPQQLVAAEEGKILLYEEDLEPLPAYEDAPAYEETEKRTT